MGFIEEMAKANAYDRMREQKEAEDAKKALHLDSLVQAKLSEQEAARQEAIKQEAMQNGMAALLNKMANENKYKIPTEEPSVPYITDKNGVPVPIDQMQGMDRNNTGLAEQYRK